MIFLQELYLKLFFIWNIKKSPWTFWSILSFFIAYDLLLLFENNFLYIIWFLIIFLSIISVPIINNYEKRTKIHDNSSIVIDELVWVFISIFIIWIFTSNFFYLFLSLVFFRYFDIKKPFIIWKVDKKIWWWLWVMLDDIIAWIFSWSLSLIIYILAKLI